MYFFTKFRYLVKEKLVHIKKNYIEIKKMENEIVWGKKPTQTWVNASFIKL